MSHLGMYLVSEGTLSPSKFLLGGKGTGASAPPAVCLAPPMTTVQDARVHFQDWWTLCIVSLMSKRTECIVANRVGCAEAGQHTA